MVEKLKMTKLGLIFLLFFLFFFFPLASQAAILDWQSYPSLIGSDSATSSATFNQTRIDLITDRISFAIHSNDTANDFATSTKFYLLHNNPISGVQEKIYAQTQDGTNCQQTYTYGLNPDDYLNADWVGLPPNSEYDSLVLQAFSDENCSVGYSDQTIVSAPFASRLFRTFWTNSTSTSFMDYTNDLYLLFGIFLFFYIFFKIINYFRKK